MKLEAYDIKGNIYNVFEGLLGMSGNVVSIISDVTQQIMEHAGSIGMGVAKGVFAEYRKQRELMARQILLKRVSEAEIDIYEAGTDNEFIGSICMYMQCAAKGDACGNLDLLAQVIAGEMKRDKIFPDKFHKYINVLSSLTRDEILIIGTYIRCYQQASMEAKKAKEVNINFPSNIKHLAWSGMMHELSPSSFPTREHIEVICGSLMRTGLTTAQPPQLGQSASHAFTILLDEISILVDFKKSYHDYPKY